MTNWRNLSLTSLLLITETMTVSYAQDFSSPVYETDLEVIINGKSFGDFFVKVSDSEVVELLDSRFEKVLLKLLKKESFKKLQFSEGVINLESLPFRISYDTENLVIRFAIPFDLVRASFYNIDTDPALKYEGLALSPAPVSGSIGFTVEKGFASDYLGGDYFSNSYQSFLNVKGFVLSTEGYYQKNENSDDWFRGNTSLVKDDVKRRIRYQLGDTSSQGMGLMNARNIGGLTVSKQFSINPYDRPFPQGEQEFNVLSRSRVRTFVNGTLIKDEFLPAGNYKLSRLPLIDGVNFVRVEIEDALGKKEVLTFDIPTSLSILKEGKLNFSASVGKEYQDVSNKREYNGSDIASFFAQYGFSKSYSGALYALKEDNYHLGGLVHGLSTSYGNFFIENGFSSFKNKQGGANTFTWQFQNVYPELFTGLSTNFRVEHYLDDFLRQSDDITQPLSHTYSVSLSYPIMNLLSLNFGGGVSYYRDESLDPRRFYNVSSTLRLNQSLNLSAFASQSEDYQNLKTTTASLFLTWNFASSRHYTNYYQDLENDTSRLTFTGDNNNEIYEPRYAVSYENQKNDKRLAPQVSVPLPMVSVAARAVVAKEEESGQTHGQGILTAGTSFLFAFNKEGEGSFGISRSNSGSFALFAPSEELKGSKVLIRSTSPYADTETPAIGDLTIPNLVDYQYREVQVDPTYLKDGLSLEREKYILHSQYKSGHFIEVNSNGRFAAEGKITYKGKPVVFKLIKLGSWTSFTNDEGEFYVEGVEEGQFILSAEGLGQKNIEVRSHGNDAIFDLGEIEMKKE